jgi:hypothetical protein
MRTDPTETGGLFVGRRPGTAPVRFRALPQRGSLARQRIDRFLGYLLLAGMIIGSLLCWGPIPIACLWVGSRVAYLSGSISFGVLIAIVALFVLLFGTLMVLRRFDSAWILVRRAAGYDQRTGALSRVFAATAAVCAAAFSFWFLIVHGPGSSVTPGNQPGNAP